MESKNADFLREGLYDASRNMTPLERLDAFVAHSLRMRALKELGEARRNPAQVGEARANG